MATLDGLLGRLDADPQQRGREWERVCRWFLANDPVYRRELRRVWLWDEWPGRWGADAGIDLVAEAHNGDLWAVQAKAYDPAHSITKRDVDTFLSESARPEFAFRLLIATTDRIGRTAQRTIEDQEKPASVLLLGDLRATQVTWPRSPSALRAARPRPKKPRPHQRQATTAVVDGFETSDRGQLIMACGTGKTLASLFIAEKLAAKRTLVLVPSLSLLAQTLREWTANSTTGFDFLPVCSDDTVADPDAAVSTTSELGFPVTTDPTEIAAFLRRRSGSRVVFATYQSSPRIAEAFQLGRVPHFDLVIADEAHRCAGRVSSDFATVLDPDALPAHKRLFMTATPRYFTGRVVKEAKQADFEVASMDDETRFGQVLHRLGFAEAIDRGLLTDYQVVIVGVDDATYLDWAEQGRFVTTDGTTVTDARTLAGQIGLAKAMRRYDLTRTISFHSRVSKAREFAASMPEVIDWMPARQRPKGLLWADYASGEMPAGSRATLIDRLRHLEVGERGLLANARCLAEGVDVPALDGVAFIDPRRSEVDIVQAVGRAIRLSDQKTVGTIVIPVFIGPGDDPETALDSSAFKPVWDVIKALRSHDDALAERLDELRRQLGQGRTRVPLPDKIHLDLPSRISANFADAFDSLLVERTTSNWEFWFGLLQQFTEQTGSASPPVSLEYEGAKLGSWVNSQRALRRQGTLDHHLLVRLEGLPGWVWEPQEQAWERGLQALRTFVEREGHAWVPQDWSEGDYPLGTWVGNQRAFYRRRLLGDARLGRLEAVPGWTWDSRAAAWEDAYKQLCTFVASTGTALVPQDQVEDGFALGRWVNKQRIAYRRGTLDADRSRKLDQLPGWAWEVADERWESTFKLLTDYVTTQGNPYVPRDLRVNGVNLGLWVQNQRSRRKRLTALQRHCLEELAGWSWDPRQETWDQSHLALMAFVDREGHCEVPPDLIEEDIPVGRWVLKQRAAFRSGRLAADRRSRLDAIPGWRWLPHEERWEQGLALLEEFARSTGHVVVPSNYRPGGFDLATWVERQRGLRRRDQLAADRAHRLDAIPKWTWDPGDARWEEGFAYLAAWTGRYGYAAPPIKEEIDGFRLGHWVSTQRQFHKKGSLSTERAERLEALPGWVWDARK